MLPSAFKGRFEAVRPFDGLAFSGRFTPVLAKHSKNFSLQDSLSVGVDRMQRNFEPMRDQVERWRSQQLTDGSAKLIIYRAFIESDLDAPKHLAPPVHGLYSRRNTRNSRLARSGACRMRSRRRSRNSIRFPSSRRRLNLGAFYSFSEHELAPGQSR